MRQEFNFGTFKGYIENDTLYCTSSKKYGSYSVPIISSAPCCGNQVNSEVLRCSKCDAIWCGACGPVVDTECPSCGASSKKTKVVAFVLPKN